MARTQTPANQWNEQYAQATKVLSLAYATDLAAYDAIASDSKSFWAERKPDRWPDVDGYRDWHVARVALLAAEETVIEVLRWRCAEIRLGLPMDSIAPQRAALVVPAEVNRRGKQPADTVLAQWNERGESAAQ